MKINQKYVEKYVFIYWFYCNSQTNAYQIKESEMFLNPGLSNILFFEIDSQFVNTNSDEKEIKYFRQ